MANIEITDKTYMRDNVRSLNIFARFVNCAEDATVELTYNNEQYYFTSSTADQWGTPSDGSVLKYYEIPINFNQEIPYLVMIASTGSVAGTIYVELAFRKGSGNTVATNTFAGIVRPTAASSISVVLEDVEETGAVAGDIDLKVGEEFQKDPDGTLHIATGMVSRSVWSSLEIYSDGWSINDQYGFQYLSSGNIRNLVTGEVIVVSKKTAESILDRFPQTATTP